MLATLTPQQVRDAEKYFSQEPYGERVLHEQVAILITLIHNYIAPKGKSVKVDDFMPGRKLVKQMSQLKRGDAMRGWLGATGKNVSVVH